MPNLHTPYSDKNFRQIAGYRMAYIDEGQGDAVVFQHGNPTSSYLWRNVMPHCEGLGRLIACDLVGMGDSEKLSPSGPERYSFQEHSKFLDALWDELDLGDRITLVVHDWGSVLGFDWANRHRDRIKALVYMESIVQPLRSELLPGGAAVATVIRSPLGEKMMLEDNAYVEQRLPASVIRTLSDEEMSEYRRPFLIPGEDRRPTLSWPRQVPIDGDPADVTSVVEAYGRWLSETPIPKLFINADPGVLLTGPSREFCRTWPNQIEVTVPGLHFIQEDSPDEIGTAIADFIGKLQ